jgi:hypothetical protein
VIDEKGSPLLNGIHRDGRITGVPANTTKGSCSCLIGVGLSPGEFTVGGASPKVGAAGMEKRSSEGAEGTNELAGIATLESGA